MNQVTCPTCDRHGHVIVPNETAIGKKDDRRSSGGLKWSRTARIQKIAGKQVTPPAAKTPIKQILAPIDATHIKVANLEPVFHLARSWDAQVTFFHCYVTPSSFSFLRGPFASAEVLYHRNMVRAQLHRLQSQLRKLCPKSKCCLVSGSLLEEILRVSKRINADLIIVPTSLDLITDCWTTASLIDELARRANCPVLACRAGKNWSSV
jgi:nucleotide-binding universal stress UspA family protein